MIIRRSKPEDARAIKEIHVAAYQTSYRGYIPDNILNDMAVTEEQVQRTAEYLTRVEGWVAEDNNKILGFAYVVYPEPEVIEISLLYVHPDYHKQKVGSTLLSCICQEKKEQGYKKIIVWTLKNGPSIGFYQKMGLIQIAGEQKMWKYNLPIICFEKELTKHL